MLRIIPAAFVPLFVILLLVVDTVGLVEDRQFELYFLAVLLSYIDELCSVLHDSIKQVLVLTLVSSHYLLDVSNSHLLLLFLQRVPKVLPQPSHLHQHILLRFFLDLLLLVKRKLLGNIVEEQLLSFLMFLVPLCEFMLAEVVGMEGDFPEFIVVSGLVLEFDGVLDQVGHSIIEYRKRSI